MEKCNKIAALYIATLKAMAQIHQHNHWLTKGMSFYGNHLLFERLYDSALKNLDVAAEKFISLFGDEVINYDFQAELLNKVLLKYSKLEGSPLEMSLAVEKDFVKFSETAYLELQDEDKFSLGLDDMVMTIASDRETSIYLLQQALKD